MDVNNNEEVEIDLVELLGELLRHWKQILVSILLVAAAAFAFSKMCITPMYTSTSELYVLSSSTSITSLADIQVGTSLTSDYQEVITGRPVLEQVIENLNMDCDYEDLEDRVEIANPSDSRLLSITVSDPDAEEAKRIADELAEVSAQFIAEKMSQDPPNIIQYGYVNESPSSPDILKNTAIGGLLGAVLSILVVVISYLLNDTIASPEDIEKKLGLNVLASIPKGSEEYDGDDSKNRHRRKKIAKADSSKPKKKAVGK